jgi:hypothetical protein
MVFASSRAQVFLGLTKGSGVIDIQATDEDEVSHESGAQHQIVPSIGSWLICLFSIAEGFQGRLVDYPYLYTFTVSFPCAPVILPPRPLSNQLSIGPGVQF